MKDRDFTQMQSDASERQASAVARGTPSFANFFVDHAKNAELWDTDGNRYIDFVGGIGVLNTGHSHPDILAAAQAQMSACVHCCYTVAPYEGYVRLAERLNDSAPIKGPAKTSFFTTGVEAVENAIKIAKAHTGRSAVIAFNGSFHGRTAMGMALTGKVAPYKIGMGPFPGDIFHAPFPSHGVTSAQSLDAVRTLFKTVVEAERVAAIIVEPVQGEGGFNPAPATFLSGLREICDAHGIVLIADEIQAGFGRTGKLFAIEHSNVQPDLITIAKSLAGGFPLSGVIGAAHIMDAPMPGTLGGTYAGNPVAIAAAHAVLDVIDGENLLARSQQLGDRLMDRLNQWRATDQGIGDVRGVGSMVAVELYKPDAGPFAFDTERAKQVQHLALQRGLMILLCGPGGSAIRFLYPLTIENDVFDEGLDILDSCLRDTV